LSKFDEEITRLIEEEHSKAQCMKIVRWVASDADKMRALMNLFFSENIRHCQRASWPLMYIGSNASYMVKPYLKKMVQVLDHAKHDAVVRNVVRVCEDAPIPKEIEGQLLEKSFEFINDPKRAVAIRAFSINVADKICQHYPELQEELKLVLLEHIDHGTAAFRIRAKKVIKKMK